MSSVSKGRAGERVAADYLHSLGFEILQKNFKSPAGEVDIVAVRGWLIVFVEVKTWSCFRDDDLERAFGRTKRERIVRTSRDFLARHPGYDRYSVRFDAVLISSQGEPLRHIEGAFGDVWCE
jgi:putative endonuclease